MAVLTLGSAAPGASFDQPYDMLYACHERVSRSLALLGKLVRHVAVHGCDGQAREAANDVLRYFDMAAPAHHLDEELHVFPLLERLGNAELSAVVRRLRDDHLKFTHTWSVLRALLLRVAARDATVPEGLEAAAQRFIELHAEHLVLEDEQVFVAARAAMDAQALALMGQEMAQRRGVKPGPY